MKLKLHISADNINSLTWDDMEAFETFTETQRGWRGVREAIARFVVNGKNEPLPRDEAMEQLGQLGLEEIRQVVEQFFNKLSEATVPKSTGDD